MVFVHCTNCGHDKHEGRCGNTSNHIAIACMCSNYSEGQINDIDKLTKIIQSVNKQDSEYREKKRKGKDVNMDAWIITHLKLYALIDRWNRHYGIMNYRTEDPI